MKLASLSIFVALLLGVVAAETTIKEETARDKRDFFVSHEVPIYPLPTRHLVGHLAHDALHRNAAHATAAAAKAAQFSKAAHAAQAVAIGESSLAEKTTAAVKAADKTYNLAVSLTHKLRAALSQAEDLTAQAWKSLEGAKVVQAAQSAMVYEAQRVADALSQKHFFSISQLQAAQAEAVKAQAVATKALAVASAKDISKSVYSDDDHHTY